MITAILIIVIGIISSTAILYVFKQKRSIFNLQASKQKLENDFNEINTRNQSIINDKEQSIINLQIELSNIREKIPSFETKIEYEQSSIRDLKNKISNLEIEIRDTREKHIAIETEKNFLQKQHQDNIKQIEGIQSAMKLQFENLANKIFTDNSKNFKNESETRLSEILSPLKIEIENFKNKFENSFTEQTKQQFSLKSEIEKIVQVNERMSSQTINLTNALKGDFRVQGTWGEFVLERILEESGLRSGEDYVLQAAQMGIKHPEENNKLKPDVIVKLPENKHVIIDSKVSLTDYEKYHSEPNENQKVIYLKQFINSIKNHITDLQGKRYQDAEQLSAPDFVLMFMPIESAYCLATKNDHNLHNYAWSRKIILVCPTTLYSTLRTIASIWKVELQKNYSLEIAKQGASLYEKVCGFIEDMQDLGKQLKKSHDSYDNAMKKLATGKGNIIVKTQKLDKLGVKTSKKLLKLIPEAFNEEEDDDLKESIIVDASEEPTSSKIDSTENKSIKESEKWDEIPF